MSYSVSIERLVAQYNALAVQLHEAGWHSFPIGENRSALARPFDRKTVENILAGKDYKGWDSPGIAEEFEKELRARIPLMRKAVPRARAEARKAEAEAALRELGLDAGRGADGEPAGIEILDDPACAERDIWVYHGTASKLLPRILRDGLLAIPPRSFEDFSTTVGAGVFVAASSSDVDIYASRASAMTDSRAVYLELLVPCAWLREDPDDAGIESGYWQFLIEHDVPPERIMRVQRRGVWEPGPGLRALWARGWRPRGGQKTLWRV